MSFARSGVHCWRATTRTSAFFAESFRSPFCEPGSNAIIAAQGIAAGKNQTTAMVPYFLLSPDESLSPISCLESLRDDDLSTLGPVLAVAETA